LNIVKNENILFFFNLKFENYDLLEDLRNRDALIDCSNSVIFPTDLSG